MKKVSTAEMRKVNGAGPVWFAVKLFWKIITYCPPVY